MSTSPRTFPFQLILAALPALGVAQTPETTLGKPDVVIIAAGMPSPQQSMLLTTARGFYRFWNTNDDQTLKRVLSPHFMDRNLPDGRPQGPTGPSFANTQFHQAVPDLHCEVTQQIIPGDRVVSNLRFTCTLQGHSASFAVRVRRSISSLRISCGSSLEDHGQLAPRLNNEIIARPIH
jgi:predicted ester cyclase